ncbi:MAG: hypothetical protein IJL87_06895 [Clostridia bacterium]|nr:hypothetical protein [Clostridia bacterium]
MKNTEKRKSEKPKYVIKVINTAAEKGGKADIPSDVLGSYTGKPYNGEVPEQDADDL